MTVARPNAAVPECTLERNTGEVRVEFDERGPEALLARTLAVESECCSFFELAYDPAFRSLPISVAWCAPR